MSEQDECSLPRLRRRVKIDKPCLSSTISSSDGPESRTGPKRKKAGRPIAYKGDPDSTALTETERRKIKRRIANRESARRVRAKRAGTLEELQIEMDHLTERNSSLLRRIAEAEGANAAVKSQLQEFCQKLRLTQVDNSLLQQQIAFLQKQQKVPGTDEKLQVKGPQSATAPVDSTNTSCGLSKSLCGDSQELLLDGMSCGFGAPAPSNVSAEDMACLPYLDNFEGQNGQSLLFT